MRGYRYCRAASDFPRSALRITYGLFNIVARMAHLATTCIQALVTMFLIGMAGSTIVVVISFVEDFQELFGDDD